LWRQIKLRLTPEAISDLELIRQYLFERSPGGATNVLGAIPDALNVIAEHPLAAQATEYQDTRSSRSRISLQNLL
jgi:plasmid stabilization system protein ParE